MPFSAEKPYIEDTTMIDLSWWLRHATLLWYVPIQLSPFRRGPPSKMENTLRENNLRGCHFSLSRSNRTTVA